ncbi:MAG: flavodoxin family protein [Candidatus Aminicenantia bacterium]
MKVKILGISGSPREGSNTETLIREALSSAEKIGNVETEFISITSLRITPCKGCYECYGFYKGADWDRLCFQFKDDVPIVYEKIREADGIIIGSPVYSMDVPAKLKALMERGAPFCHYASSKLSGALSFKVIGGIVVAFEKRGGQESTLFSIWRFASSLSHSFIVSATPFPLDPPPQSSFFGGLADTSSSTEPLSGNAVLREYSREKPPISSIYSLRSVRNLGRSVALSSMIVKAGLEKLKEIGIELPKLPVSPFPAEMIKEGSYLARIRRGEEEPPDYQEVWFLKRKI